MKNLFTVIFLLAITALFGQGFNYKALITDSSGNALNNQSVVVRFTVLNGTHAAVYEETHNVSTDANGILSVNVGEGSVVGGDFTMIDWGGDTYFLKTEIDLNDGNGWQDFGTTAFKYVPYAKYAETGDYRGLTHKPGVWYSSVTYNPATNSSEDIYRTGMVVIGNIGNSLPSNISRSKLYVYDDLMTGRSALMSVNYEGTDNTDKMGEYIRMAGDVSTGQYGAYYELSTTGSGALNGEKVDLTSANDADHYGMKIEINGSGAGHHTGQSIYINTGGQGSRIGSVIQLVQAGTGIQTGQAISISNTNNDNVVFGQRISLEVQGNGLHYGLKNDIDAYSTGITRGLANYIHTHSSGIILGLDNNIIGSGTGEVVAVQNYLGTATQARQTGTYNILDNNGDGERIGTKNAIRGTGSGDKYGSFNIIAANAGGDHHYAVYGEALKAGAGIYAGYFNGNVMVTKKLKGPVSGDNDMKAYIYGHIRNNGTIQAGSDGFTVSHNNTGIYRILFSDQNLGPSEYVVVATSYASSNPEVVTFVPGNGYFDIYVWNLSGNLQNSNFSFVVYKK